MGREWNTGAALVAETWPGSWRGRALGLVQSSWAIGYAAAAVVANAVLAQAGWRWVSFVGVLPALLVLWIRRGVPEPAVWTASRGHRVSREERRRYWRKATPHIAVLVGMNTCGMFAWWGLFTWIPAYLTLPRSGGARNFSLLGLTTFLVVLKLISRAAFTTCPLHSILPSSQARVARARVLKNRAAHNHLSILMPDSGMNPYLLLTLYMN